MNGVVLVSWRQEILERQIDYGAQLGHVILGLARMELQNFYRNVMPVAEYFDQSGMLIAVSLSWIFRSNLGSIGCRYEVSKMMSFFSREQVNGERNPGEVYIDFREAVMKILGMSDGDERRGNPPGSVEAEVKVERNLIPVSPPPKQTVVADLSPPPPISIDFHPSKTADKPRKGLPYFIWVIGAGFSLFFVSTQSFSISCNHYSSHSIYPVTVCDRLLFRQCRWPREQQSCPQCPGNKR